MFFKCDKINTSLSYLVFQLFIRVRFLQSNTILECLATPTWRKILTALRTYSLAHASPVNGALSWCRCLHAENVEVPLNEATKASTSCVRSTSIIFTKKKTVHFVKRQQEIDPRPLVKRLISSATDAPQFQSHGRQSKVNKKWPKRNSHRIIGYC